MGCFTVELVFEALLAVINGLCRGWVNFSELVVGYELVVEHWHCYLYVAFGSFYILLVIILIRF
jgi:hypothetical protein